MAVKRAIIQLNLNKEEVVTVAGIGCHGKITDYIKTNSLHAIHGRVLPPATAIKLANPELTVIGFAGDGDAYNIGLGHFPHAARRNIDITYMVHNNLVYGLTTGQTSPTSREGYESKSTPRGAFPPAINPLTTALTSHATFVARGFAGDMHHLTDIMKEAINHKGFALLDIFQPCVAWYNTYDFFEERVYKLGETDHDITDKKAAYEKAEEWGDNIPIGVFYTEERPTYQNYFPFLEKGPLVNRKLEGIDTTRLLEELK
jgi:2-oxoglutarate ferredoxin oxidoreductase subunit beta